MARKRKTIDELFEETRDYDHIVVPENSLARGLNARLAEPGVGRFAGTATQFSSKGYTLDRTNLYIKMVRETSLTWRQAEFLLDNVEESMENHGNLSEITADSRFNGDSLKQALDLIRNTSNVYTARQEYEMDGNIAVVMPEMLTELDREILPEEYDDITVFRDEEIDPPEFDIFPSSGEISRAVTRNITQDNQENTAIVVRKDSRYSRLIKNILKSAGLEVETGNELGRDERRFLVLCEVAMTESRVRSRDVRPITRKLDLAVKGKYLSREQVEEIREFLNVTEYMTFGELLSGYREVFGESGEIEEKLEELGFIEREISESDLKILERLMREDESSEGVLMVDPEDSVFIDRGNVFYIGVDSDWYQDTIFSNRDHTSEEFLALIQNGDSRAFMAQEFRAGEEVTPCLYLKKLFDADSFTSFSFQRYSKQHEEEEKDEREQKNWEEIDTVSQKDLNYFQQSPRSYYFSQVVSGDSEKAQVKGNLIHQFAEYAFNNFERLEDIDNSEIVNLMMQEIDTFIESREREKFRTEFQIGVKSIRKLVDRTEIQRFEHDMASGRSENIFADEFGGSVESDFTEMYFRNTELGVKGKIDIIISEDHLMDIKTSRKPRKPKDIVRKSLPSIESDRPDFQPALYLLQFCETFGHRETEFSYFFTHGALEKDLKGEDAFDEKKVTVKYRPWSFDEELQKIRVFEHLIRDVQKQNDRRKTLEKLGVPEFQEFLSQLEADFRDAEAVDEEVLPEFISFTKKRVGDYRYVEKGCESALNKIMDYRLSGFYREDLEDFRGFLEETIESINRYREAGFPSGDKTGEEPFSEMIIDGA